MKGLRTNRLQEIGIVGVFCAHSGLRRDGVIHGFLATNERSVRHVIASSIPVRYSSCVAFKILEIPLPAFHVCSMDAPLWAEWAYVAGVGICGASPRRLHNETAAPHLHV